MPDDLLIEDALDHWEDLRDEGKAIPLEQFVEDHCGGWTPENVGEFLRQAAALDQIDRRLRAEGFEPKPVDVPATPSKVGHDVFFWANVNTDRNLLVGLLALQVDFVTRGQLVAAMRACVHQKHKPIGQLFVEQGVISQAQYALLESLVQEHLAAHEGDPRKSLGSVRSLVSTLQELEGIEDPEFQAGLEAIPCSRTERGRDEAPLCPKTLGGSPNSTGSRFQILRQHAKGGLGVVFLAHDSELNRQVALKEIQGRYADDAENRARFLTEAEVTGNLEHPGVVPIYSLGNHTDGRPFYAMRFIKGESFKDAIGRLHAADGDPRRDLGERILELQKLLRRFLDVCETIAYAHSRGILHRDLKPGNVMVGRFGETMVVDWGLAKVVAKQEHAGETSVEETLPPGLGERTLSTLTGSALGTPAYMSPEQADGRLKDLGPASDVYSLGAMLYCLLTGHAPFEDKNVHLVLAKVKSGEFPQPRAVNPKIPVALEAICLKAMALHPQGRYRSAKELAADIESWLADEPVSAWRERWPIRALRWSRRHQTAVEVTATALLLALSLGGIALYMDQQRVRQDMVGLSTAMARAQKLWNDARIAWAQRLDPLPWSRAQDAAAAAVAVTSSRLPAALRRRSRLLAEQVEAEARSARSDGALLADLTNVRAARGDPQFDASREYLRAFAAHGVPILTDATSAATRLAGRPVTVAVRLASFLDDWALLLRNSDRDPARITRVVGLARAIDPDRWRGNLRDTIEEPDGDECRRVLLRLCGAADVAAQPAPTLTLLASGLIGSGDPEAAVRLLNLARFAHNNDPWIHQELGLVTISKPL